MNIVRESLDFERGLDPIKSMSIGALTWVPRAISNMYKLDKLELIGDIDITATGKRFLVYVKPGYNYDKKIGIKKIDYITNILKEVGIEKLFKEIEWGHHMQYLLCRPKDEYVIYFKNVKGTYDS
jgi:hypothetical protein